MLCSFEPNGWPIGTCGQRSLAASSGCKLLCSSLEQNLVLRKPAAFWATLSAVLWWLKATAAHLHRLIRLMSMCTEVFCCDVRYVVSGLRVCQCMFNTRPGHPALLGWQLPPLGHFSNCLRFTSGQFSSDIRISRVVSIYTPSLSPAAACS